MTVWNAAASFLASSSLEVRKNFAAGLYDETGTAEQLSIPAYFNTEIEFGLTLDLPNLTSGDTLDFRVTVDDRLLPGYDITPRVVVVAVYAATAAFVGSSTAAFAATRRAPAATAFAGASSLVATASRVVRSSATFASISNATVVAQQVLRATASLASVGTTAIDSQQFLRAAAKFSAASDLDAFAFIAGQVIDWQGSARLVASGQLLPLPIQWMAALAGCSGNASLSAAASAYRNIVASLTGSSTLSSVARQRQFAEAKFSAAGNLSIDTFSFAGFVAGRYDETGDTSAIAVPAGFGTELEFGLVLSGVNEGDHLSLRVYVGHRPLQVYDVTPQIFAPLFVAPRLSGQGLLAATAGLVKVNNRATLRAYGALTANTFKFSRRLATARLAGTGALRAATIRFIPLRATARLAGAGAWSARVTAERRAIARFPATSALRAATLRLIPLQARARLAGSSTLVAIAQHRYPLQATVRLAGAAAVYFDPQQRPWRVSVRFPSQSALAAATFWRMNARARLVTAATVTASTIASTNIRSSIGVISRVIARSTIIVSAQADLGGAGVARFIAFFRGKIESDYLFSGSGALVSSSIMLKCWQTDSLFHGAGKLVARSMQLRCWQSSVLLKGAGKLRTSSFAVRPAAAVLAGSALMHVEATRQRPKRHWRRTASLQGSVAQRDGLRGSVRQDDHLDGGWQVN